MWAFWVWSILKNNPRSCEEKTRFLFSFNLNHNLPVPYLTSSSAQVLKWSPPNCFFRTAMMPCNTLPQGWNDFKGEVMTDLGM